MVIYHVCFPIEFGIEPGRLYEDISSVAISERVNLPHLEEHDPNLYRHLQPMDRIYGASVSCIQQKYLVQVIAKNGEN